jgi:TolB-like protein
MKKLQASPIVRKFLILAILALVSSPFIVMAQNSDKPTLAVIAFRNDHTDPKAAQYSLSDFLRLELEKLDRYQVLDRFDMDYILTQNKIEYNNCLSRFCLEDISQKINVEKLAVGNIKVLDGRISITVKIFDKKTKQFEKAQTSEFLDIPAEIGMMIHMTVNELNGIKNDEAILKKLTQKNDFESSVNNPEQLCLRSDGPRMGFTSYIFEPSVSKVLQDKKFNGGYEAIPVMFQFGYQIEKQYLNEGNFQALFEFIPMITGLDQGLFIPSLTVMNGIRNNTSGWEFAFGPTISLIKKAEGYYDEKGDWVRLAGKENKSGFDTESRLDSRGAPKFSTGFVIAGGKTFKSGKLNIPVNLYVIPNSSGVRFGVSFGFNAKSRYCKR